jgi:hypothetical protein
MYHSFALSIAFTLREFMHADQVDLFTVEDTFAITGRGVIAIPNFAPPTGWLSRKEHVTIIAPGGARTDIEALFSVTHFAIRDPTALDKSWRLEVSFPKAKKDDIPIGAKVMVSPTLREAILGATTFQNDR